MHARLLKHLSIGHLKLTSSQTWLLFLMNKQCLVTVHMHNKLHCWAHSFIHSHCKYEQVGWHSHKRQRELFDQIPASNKQDLNATVCVHGDSYCCWTRLAGAHVALFFLTSKDELCEEFHKSSADVKESDFKTDCGQKLMQRSSTEGKFSEWNLSLRCWQENKFNWQPLVFVLQFFCGCVSVWYQSDFICMPLFIQN